MKIVDHEIILLNNIEPYRGGRHWIFLQLITDEGIIGLGERPSGNTGRLEGQISLLRDLCQEFVIGANPFDIEALWQRIFASRHDYRHPGLDATPALSAIEMACWDIVGKALNQPIYDLHQQIFVEPIRFEQGYITPPTGPGLGVTLDPAVVKRQRV